MCRTQRWGAFRVSLLRRWSCFPMRCTVVQMMDRFTSPVFFSVNERGELNHGLGSVPDYQEGRSILFVGNHQLLGIDMPILVRRALCCCDNSRSLTIYFSMALHLKRSLSWILTRKHPTDGLTIGNPDVVVAVCQVRKILAEKNILVRGLAHPVVTGCGTGDLFETIKRQQESDETQVWRGNNVVTQVALTLKRTTRLPSTFRKHVLLPR